MEERAYRVISTCDDGKVLLYNNLTGHEEYVDIRSVESFLQEGICFPAVRYLSPLENGRKYVIAFESLYRAKVYYSGFNLSYRNNINISSELSDAKVYRKLSKLYKDIARLECKCEQLAIMVIEVRTGR